MSQIPVVCLYAGSFGSLGLHFKGWLEQFWKVNMTLAWALSLCFAVNFMSLGFVTPFMTKGNVN